MEQRTLALGRRQVLEMLGKLGIAAAVGCGRSITDSTTSSGSSSGSGATGGGGTGNISCAVTPDDTAGPYPDKIGMLGNAAFYRQNITEGKAGLPLTLNLTVVNAKNSCGPVVGAAVEIWQCDAIGEYSEYAQPGYDGTGQTFLRGLQTTDTSGKVSFTTVYPGWYTGRATHIHVEIYANGVSVKTTQIAFPESVSASVYATGVYAAHGQNSVTNAADNVFADGDQYELATLAGDPTTGYTASLTITVSV